MARILVCDDHEVVRRGIHELLRGHPGMDVCGEARDAAETLDLAAALRPDVVVLDLTMPGSGGLDLVRELRRIAPDTKILVFSFHKSEALANALSSAGADGYVCKGDLGRTLVKALEALSGHRTHFPPRPHRRARARTPQLTARERQVVQLLAEGLSNKEIALALAISVKTVETHRAHVLRKIGSSSIAQVVRFAVRQQIIEP